MEKINDIAKAAISGRLAKAIESEKLLCKEAAWYLGIAPASLSLLKNRKNCPKHVWDAAQKWANSGLSIVKYDVHKKGSTDKNIPDSPIPATDSLRASGTTDPASKTPVFAELAIVWGDNIERLGRISLEDAIKHVKESEHLETFYNSGVSIFQMNLLYTAKIELKEERF